MSAKFAILDAILAFNETQIGCTACSEGFYYYDSTCNTGCPVDTYPDSTSGICESCQSPCATCFQPNNYSCTSCTVGYYLLNNTCIPSCPYGYYQGSLGDYPVYSIPACLPKLELSFRMSLTLDPRTITIEFNYGISDLMLSFNQRASIELAGIVLSSELYLLLPTTGSLMEFQYIGDVYYPPLTVLNVTFNIETGFNSEEYLPYMFFNTTETIEMKEIYLFGQVEIQYIDVSSNLTSIGGVALASSQTAASIASGGLSLGLVRMEIVGETIQLLRFIDIQWSPNVLQFFTATRIDPSSIVLPIDFTVEWNNNLNNRNVTLPRVFDEYEYQQFLTENYNNEISNLMLLIPIVILSTLVINLLKRRFKKTAKREQPPTPNTDNTDTRSARRSFLRSF